MSDSKMGSRLQSTAGARVVGWVQMPIFEKKPVDPRVVATRSIVRSLIPILALCIPFVAILKSPLMPFIALGGAAIGISSIWFFGRSKVVATHSKEIDALEKTVSELQERLANVEVMNRFEGVLAEKEFEARDGSRSMGVVSSKNS